MTSTIRLFAILISLGFIYGSEPAHAQSALSDLTVSQSTETDDAIDVTHPLVRLTPDKSELIRLDRDAVSVVVGNPAHLSVLLDTPRVLVLIPRQPGSTHFTVLDQQSNVIMQRHAIVASPKKNYIRVRRSCANAGDDDSCQNTSVYFCPDMCHEINVEQPENTDSNDSALPEETPAGAPPAPPPEEQ